MDAIKDITLFYLISLMVMIMMFYLYSSNYCSKAIYNNIQHLSLYLPYLSTFGANFVENHSLTDTAYKIICLEYNCFRVISRLK